MFERPFIAFAFRFFLLSLTGFNGRYARARQGAFDGDPVRITEMDALVAYLQMLGTLVDFRDVTPAQLRQQ